MWKIFLFFTLFMTLNVISINLRGIQSIKNREQKGSALMNKNCDAICAQELRLTSKRDIDDVKNRWTNSCAIISIVDNRADGVGIF